ncbi:DUF1876 domain-containing protein [Planosporangium thailandense]|uniref:DUF1876 domain-containing protein n=1 Tax=Planosporangium thailandense TaxID=765197 RepID=A0ABX0Y7A7_9ACTN|nr:DUF1876 domain-containing protein [Planosporangium thailandense]NJC73310.1 DUF1876 domain-containing protein [Planosporangium thailandense]
MSTAKRWTIEVLVDEEGGRTYAEACLQSGADTRLVGIGRAKLNPSDRDIPEIGDELAAARALCDLGQRLLVSAARDIQAVTHEPVRLSR